MKHKFGKLWAGYVASLPLMLMLATSGASSAAPPAVASGIDTKKTVVVLAFETDVKGAPGFPEAARNAVVAFLKDDGLFPAVLGPDDAKAKDKAELLEITGKLVEFKGGNMATRMMVGLGSGRASAAIDFAVREAASGKVLWRKQIKEKASVWSNSASSSAQRGELPDKIAKALLKELKGGK